MLPSRSGILAEAKKKTLTSYEQKVTSNEQKVTSN